MKSLLSLISCIFFMMSTVLGVFASDIGAATMLAVSLLMVLLGGEFNVAVRMYCQLVIYSISRLLVFPFKSTVLSITHY